MKSLNFKYFISVSIIITIILGSIFTFFYFTIKKMILNQVYQKASVVADQIIILRKWIADMHGVFVIRRPGIEPNRFLPYPTLSCGEVTLVLRNPALVTKEISNMTKKLKSYYFKLTSDKVINPQNAPDKVEKLALSLFKKNKIKEFKILETKGNKKYFRLIKPLYIKESCLICHNYQGYHVGDLRGALSIFIPMDCVFKDLSNIRKIFFFSGIIIVLLATFIIYVINYFLTIKPITNLTSAIRNFSQNLEIKLESTNRKDEIGILEKNFIEMANKIKNNYEIMQKEIEKATAELKRRDKIKTDFIATMSHELRTPLTTIQGGIEYLFKVIKKQENIEFLRIIDKNLKNLILMVNNLIDIARIELGKLDLELADVNLKELLEEVILFFKGFAHEKNIKIIKENFNDFYIKIDRRRINQVLINVLHNAIKYSPENEEIKISMAKKGKYIEISFTNKIKNKITEGDLKKFFIKYKYLTSGKEKGSGLGLAIAKALMEAHNGKINVNLVEENKIKITLSFKVDNDKDFNC